MSRDNWGRLVEAVIRNEELREIARAPSMDSSDVSSRLSFSSISSDLNSRLSFSSPPQEHVPVLRPQDESKSCSGSDSKKEATIPKERTTNIAQQTFTFRELAAATKNFRPECLLGEVGFSRVFKGLLQSTGQITIHFSHPLSFLFRFPFGPEDDLNIPENRLPDEFLEWRPNEGCEGDSIGLLKFGVACIEDLSPS